MPISTGFNHIGTLTTDMNRTVRFYEEAFDAKVRGEVPPEEIIGERRRQGHRGAVDHFALAVDSRATLERMSERLVAAGAQEVGEVHELGSTLSLFFRDPDGMELEVCCPAE